MNPIGGADLTHFRRHGWLRVPHLHDANDLAVLRETMRKGVLRSRPMSARPMALRLRRRRKMWCRIPTPRPCWSTCAN